jgi:hypothetical protein
MNKILFFILLVHLPFYAYSKANEALSSAAADYVNACSAVYYLKKTYCSDIDATNPRGCLLQAVASLPAHGKKHTIEAMKEKIKESDDKVFEHVDVSYKEHFDKFKKNKKQACKSSADELLWKKDDAHYEFKHLIGENH